LIGLAGRTGLKGLANQTLDLAAIILKRNPRQAAWHAQWLSPELMGPGDREPLRCRDNLSRRLLEDATRLNLPRLLHYADRNSMAFGVEARVPYLDHRLTDFALSLAPGLRIHRGWNKHLLRLALESRVPQEIAWRKDKLGFAVPLKEWYLAGASFFRETLSPGPLIAPLFRIRDWPSHVEECLRHDRGLNWLWMLSNLETWCRSSGVSP
jgi:asparagine synthase (glutamine-hydrolysing)